MALPSQIERSAEMSRPVMTRDGGRNPRGGGGTAKPALIIGGILVAVGAIYALSQLAPKAVKPANADAGTLAQAVKSPVITPTPAPTTTQAPVSLTQGKVGLFSPPPPTTTPTATSSPTTLAQQGVGSTPASTPSTPATTPVSTPAATPSAATPPAGSPPPGGSQPTGQPAGQPTGQPGMQPGNQPSDASPPPPSLSPIASFADAGERALSAGKPLEARALWSKALINPNASSTEQAALRDKLARLNEDLVFSTKVTPGDPLCETYTVVSGDALVKIAKKRELATDWRLIQRVNRMANANALRVGQKLKLVRGPFHAVVHKSDYRLDLFFGPPDEPEAWQFVRSWTVGLGEGNGTPVGTFSIKRGSKLENPPWVNPRTGQKFDKDDPKNPIGEYWLGFQGVGSSAPLTGYGLHGTVDPQSIGKQMSMGCVRMLPDDIKQVYELLVEEVSVVKIVP